jgi:hypothetical protein
MEQENTNYGNLFGTIDLLSEEHHLQGKAQKAVIVKRD